jgi:hypothetical protein
MMPLADAMTRGVAPATMNGAPIPEIRVAPGTALDVSNDIHFGINLHPDDYPALYADLDGANQMEADLRGLGPRTIDIKRRGGRTAEDDWFMDGGQARARPRTGMSQATYAAFNDPLPIKNVNFPPGAHITHRTGGGALVAEDVSGQNRGYAVGATLKSDANGLQMGKRWSKTALESALARGAGHIHFHLTGMGDLAALLGKTGNCSHNVTSHELRYVRRFWNRFQDRVIFCNGYTGALLPVYVVPPWIPAWQPDTDNCNSCNQPFSRAFPIRWAHHCRLCGLSVCDECSSRTLRLAFAVKRPTAAREIGPVRVCDACHATFTRGAPSQF